MVDFREEHFWFWSLAAADPACTAPDPRGMRGCVCHSKWEADATPERVKPPFSYAEGGFHPFGGKNLARNCFPHVHSTPSLHPDIALLTKMHTFSTKKAYLFDAASIEHVQGG